MLCIFLHSPVSDGYQFNMYELFFFEKISQDSQIYKELNPRGNFDKLLFNLRKISYLQPFFWEKNEQDLKQISDL